MNILVPTDFNPGSSGALKSALRIATDFAGHVYLMHAIAPAYNHTEIFIAIAPTLEADAKLTLEREIKKVTVEKEFAEIPLEGITQIGSFPDAIKESISEMGINLVVMNTHGPSGISKELIGSNAASVITKSNCTFFILPYEYEFKKPGKVAIFINKDILNHNLSTLSSFLEKYNPQLILFCEADVHFSMEEESALKRVLRMESLNFLTLEDTAEVDSVALENNAEWLVMFSAHHTFMEKLFHKSLTKEIASHAKLPLLIINQS